MLRIRLTMLLWHAAVLMSASVFAMEPEADKSVVSMAEIEKTVVAVENQLNTVTVLIEEQDAKLEVLLNELDATEDLARKDSLQTLVDRLTRSLDELEGVKADLSAKLDDLKNHINRLKEPRSHDRSR